MKKVILPLLLALVLLFCSALAESSEGIGATSGTCGENLTWSLDEDGVLTISGAGDMADYTDSAPTPWDARKSAITAVVIESGVTSIGNYAFYRCGNLVELTLPEGLQSIGDNSFHSCGLLASVTLPDSVVSLGSNCFSYCYALAELHLSASLT